MRFLMSALVLLSIGVLASTAVMAMSATDQMAAKRKISLEYRLHMEQCRTLHSEAADMCEQQAKGHAEAARAALISRRNAVTRSPF
ncbi:hypothetical protein D3C80_1377870 [compost metagenome]